MQRKALFWHERNRFHQGLLGSVLTLDEKGVPSNADKPNRASVKVAAHILSLIGQSRTALKAAGQTAGAGFEAGCAAFLESTFSKLQNLRPGDWRVLRGRSIAEFEQFRHLADLAAAARKDPSLAAILGNDYVIKPDIVITRDLVADEDINQPARLVDESFARLCALRSINGGLALLHASLSCKWTIRSDRSQNSRSEALNLIRNRKGRVPHIAVITAEPLPSRLASLALGTGDIDCVYHFALYELEAAVKQLGQSEASSLLATMIDGRRLKDISDLPLDLAV